ncbi:hypothetical protein Sme01_27140 [Sphaerisporangium melleum]|uniref:Uncharacterized protein n=1 Tax=Sphaerisporangium melleum TaxID=321316 RepID=A0A917QW77_9ACTN|nr:hypothetical protein [Sphaerisporangium melleum]GGK70996.1 hypothetical protein GCM10007964_12200 [Sphaerisporangium melleum]GII70238.1 hypothetical protein Sme01_27140 [Sphaerisporangium melleum]
MTSLIATQNDAPVQFLWGTRVIVDAINLRGIARDDMSLPATGPICEDLPAHVVLTDQAALEKVFLARMSVLAGTVTGPPVTAVTVRIQGWREGYGIPAAADASAYIGWCCLAATPAPSTAESGCLSLADPRAGSDLTAMPGLPWGRQVLVKPMAGALTVAPGWLTHSVVPIEHGQQLVMAVATCSR